MMKKYESLQYFLKGNEHRPLLIKGTARVFRFKAMRTGAGCIAPRNNRLKCLKVDEFLSHQNTGHLDAGYRIRLTSMLKYPVTY